MYAAQLHICIKRDMIVIDGIYHIVNRGATLSTKGSKVHISCKICPFQVQVSSTETNRYTKIITYLISHIYILISCAILSIEYHYWYSMLRSKFGFCTRHCFFPDLEQFRTSHLSHIVITREKHVYYGLQRWLKNQNREHA